MSLFSFFVNVTCLGTFLTVVVYWYGILPLNACLGYISGNPQVLDDKRKKYLRSVIISVMVFILVLLWSIIIFYCIPESASADVRRYRIPDPASRSIPFLNGKSYLNALQNIRDREEQDNVFVVYGPKSQSKTRGIKEKCHEWENNNGDICIFIDLKGWKGSAVDYYKLVASGIVYSLSRSNTTISNDILAQIQNRFVPSFAIKYIRMFVISPIFRKFYNSFMGSTPATERITAIIDAFYDLVVSEHVEIDDFQFIYEQLDKIAADIYPKKIILILSEVQQLAKIGDKGLEIWQRLYDDYGRKKGGVTKLINIVETSESFFIIDERIRENSISFNSYEIKALEHDTTKEEVVSEYKYMNEKEFERTWRMIGGWAGAWFIILDNVKGGMKVDEALQNIYKQYNRLFISAIMNPPKNTEDKRKLLRELKGNKYVMKSKDRQLINTSIELVRENILYWDGRTLSPQNGLYQYIIDEYLEELDG